LTIQNKSCGFVTHRPSTSGGRRTTGRPPPSRSIRRRDSPDGSVRRASLGEAGRSSRASWTPSTSTDRPSSAAETDRRAREFLLPAVCSRRPREHRAFRRRQGEKPKHANDIGGGSACCLDVMVSTLGEWQSEAAASPFGSAHSAQSDVAKTTFEKVNVHRPPRKAGGRGQGVRMIASKSGLEVGGDFYSLPKIIAPNMLTLLKPDKDDPLLQEG